MKQDVALDMIKSGTDAETEIRHEAESFCPGAAIGQLRQRHRLTRQDISDICGLSKFLLSKIENRSKHPIINIPEKRSSMCRKVNWTLKPQGYIKQLRLPPRAPLPGNRTTGHLGRLRMSKWLCFVPLVSDDLTPGRHHRYRLARQGNCLWV